MAVYTITCGDVNGIGPEIAVKTINELNGRENRQFIFICPQNVFEETIKIIPPEFNYNIIRSVEEFAADSSVAVLDTGNTELVKGKPTKESGRTAYNAIILAHRLIAEGKSAAMITAPISKEAFDMAGINFPGHTELLAELSETDKYVMTFLSDELIAALTTIHIPVSEVPSSINREILEKTFSVIYDALIKDLGIKQPSVAALGLNPHAGENGKIGKEELEIIGPAIKKAGDSFKGPFVPDAFFARQSWKSYDAVIGMYHDQVLIPFKMLDRGRGVNYTAGLNFIRTSPDHGTAFDIAWKNKADNSSMTEAVLWAEKIAKNRGLA